MFLIYDLLIGLFYLAVILASIFNTKARKLLLGRNGVIKTLKNSIKPDDKIIWFHAASLGEFEQGRPVMEEIKRRKPDLKIIVTFFSPSGYEIRKNYAGADFICYLPFDFSWNARQFIKIVNPQVVYFIKYEFWYNFIHILQKKKTPLFCISANFRHNQLFFKWYGFWYKEFLHKFTHIYVQNQTSKDLLVNAGVENVTISGDTRFDRVFEIASQTKELPIIKEFSKGSKVVVAGSTWPADEDLIAKYITSESGNTKFIIAPHEIHETHIEGIISKMPANTIRYTKANEANLPDCKVLIVDNIGILSSVYQYGHSAYIGGAFGKGLHNILEAATFGLPVVFGPRYEKFKEALDLVEKGGVFSISEYNAFKTAFDKLLTDNEYHSKASAICKNYVAENRGATQVILNDLNFLIS
jgi:3-deoxy-D-manno-octulosonic-acid transferase